MYFYMYIYMICDYDPPYIVCIRTEQELRIARDDYTVTQIIYFTVYYAVKKRVGRI
jgi:hypothetical protein